MELTPEDELLILNEKLLEAIDTNDYETYTELCDVNLSAFEPEAMGQLVEGKGRKITMLLNVVIFTRRRLLSNLPLRLTRHTTFHQSI